MEMRMRKRKREIFSVWEWEKEREREREIERVWERERETKNVSDLIEKSYGFCYDNNGISKEHNKNKTSRWDNILS